MRRVQNFKIKVWRRKKIERKKSVKNTAHKLGEHAPFTARPELWLLVLLGFRGWGKITAFWILSVSKLVGYWKGKIDWR